MNLVNYFKRLGASASTSAVGVSISTGCSYLSPLVGGWIADAYLGRYRTIWASAIIYLGGLLLLTTSAVMPGIRVNDGTHASAWQWMLLILCLLLVAAGTGGIKPNVSAFGGDQFDERKERDREEKKSFFTWFYVFINIGAILASTVVVYVQDRGLWGVSFACASESSLLSANMTEKSTMTGGVMLLSTLTFGWGRSLYRCIPPSESPVMRFFATVYRALRDRPKRFSYSAVDGELGEERRYRNHFLEQRTRWLDWATESGIFIATNRPSGELAMLSCRKILPSRCSRSKACVQSSSRLRHCRVFLVCPKQSDIPYCDLLADAVGCHLIRWIHCAFSRECR